MQTNLAHDKTNNNFTLQVASFFCFSRPARILQHVNLRKRIRRCQPASSIPLRFVVVPLRILHFPTLLTCGGAHVLAAPLCTFGPHAGLPGLHSRGTCSTWASFAWKSLIRRQLSGLVRECCRLSHSIIRVAPGLQGDRRNL